MTREQLVTSLETEKDPIGAIIAYIQKEESGYIRHDLDAQNNGWDPYEYPEEGYVWQEAVHILSEAAGVEDILDTDDIDDAWVDLYDDLCEATWDLLLDDDSRL